ncbi:MAG: hypothetical protein KF708_24230 [Pirellulales bacterium]|nr:hypothetical protein [Pirellulales bacterium]
MHDMQRPQLVTLPGRGACKLRLFRIATISEQGVTVLDTTEIIQGRIKKAAGMPTNNHQRRAAVLYRNALAEKFLRTAGLVLVKGEFKMTTRVPGFNLGYVPTAREIKEMCGQIQTSWSPTERFWRIVRNRPAWLCPTVRVLVLPLEPTRRRRHPQV